MQDRPLADDPVVGDISVVKKKSKTATASGQKTGHVLYQENNKVVNGANQQQVVGTYKGCWVIDNVIIVNMANVPSSLQEGFSPVDPSLWHHVPGAHFKVGGLPMPLLHELGTEQTSGLRNAEHKFY